MPGRSLEMMTPAPAGDAAIDRPCGKKGRKVVKCRKLRTIGKNDGY